MSRYSNPPWSISRDVERELPWLTEELGFRKFEDVYPQSFGNSYATYVRGNLRVRFVYDRGETLVWISPTGDPGTFEPLRFVCEFLGGKRIPEASTFVEYGKLLRDHLDAIEQAFGPDFLRIKPAMDEFGKKYEQENIDRVIAEGRAQRAAGIDFHNLPSPQAPPSP